MKSIREFLLQRPDGPLYHYTTASGLLGMLERKEIWASSALHLNDAKVFQHAHNLLKGELRKRLHDVAQAAALSPEWKGLYREWEDESSTTDPDVYVVSFSTEGNQLSQWRAYCRDGNGFSIGFGLPDLAYARATSNFHLVKCVYDPAEQGQLIDAAIRYMERVWARDKSLKGCRGWNFFLRMTAKLQAVMLALKDPSFSEEEEWRLVGGTSKTIPRMFRPGRFGIVPYCAIPLCKPDDKPSLARVFIGPNLEPAVAKIAVEDLLRDETTPFIHDKSVAKTEVVESGIPYRW